MEPEPYRPGAPEGATYRWMELTDGPEPWFKEELGLNTRDDYFGAKNHDLRERRIKQIAAAAKEHAEEEKRIILERTVTV